MDEVGRRTPNHWDAANRVSANNRGTHGGTNNCLCSQFYNFKNGTCYPIKFLVDVKYI